MIDGTERRVPCPECGRLATFTYSAYLGRGYHWCPPCNVRKQRETCARQQEIRRALPTLSTRVVTVLESHFRESGVPAILAATDDDLLGITNFGTAMLAEFRAAWPSARSRVSVEDPWREHAEMVAGVR